MMIDEERDDTMQNELKLIKSKYGEKMAYFCRDNFQIILEKDGTLFSILTDTFDFSRSLFADIVEQNQMMEFKKFIFKIYHKNVDTKKEEDISLSISPFELMQQAGYTLTKCETHDDVLSFKKYWKENEALCTFRDGNRINNHLIFFAVKHNVDEIKREDFAAPKRQDEYGTSAISIQISKKDGYLSIKNRYNHTVANPDATFSNNLDNIIAGLTQSFEKFYNIKLNHKSKIDFELKNYVVDTKGKYYKYNNEINNVYFCTNNIVLSQGRAIKYDKARYDLIDCFIIDKQEKTIKSLSIAIDPVNIRGGVGYGMIYNFVPLSDAFTDYFEKGIKKIEVVKQDKDRIFNITMLDDESCWFKVNVDNCMIEYHNDYLINVKDNFLKYGKKLKVLSLLNLKTVGDSFLASNRGLISFIAPKLEKCGNNMFFSNNNLLSLDLPNLKMVGKDFCYANQRMKIFKAPNLELASISFLRYFSISKLVSD